MTNSHWSWTPLLMPGDVLHGDYLGRVLGPCARSGRCRHWGAGALESSSYLSCRLREAMPQGPPGGARTRGSEEPTATVFELPRFVRGARPDSGCRATWGPWAPPLPGTAGCSLSPVHLSFLFRRRFPMNPYFASWVPQPLAVGGDSTSWAAWGARAGASASSALPTALSGLL